MHDSSFGWRFINPKMKEIYGVDGMGTTAENLAELYDISREDQDKFASILNKRLIKLKNPEDFLKKLFQFQYHRKRKIPFYLNMMSLLKEIHQLKFYQNSELLLRKMGEL